MNLVPTFQPPPSALGTHRQSLADRMESMLMLLSMPQTNNLDFQHSFETNLRQLPTKRSPPELSQTCTGQSAREQSQNLSKKAKTSADNLHFSLFDGALNWSQAEQSKVPEVAQSQSSLMSKDLSQFVVHTAVRNNKATADSNEVKKAAETKNSRSNLYDLNEASKPSAVSSGARVASQVLSTTSSSQPPKASSLRVTSSLSATISSSSSVQPTKPNSFKRLAAVFERSSAPEASSGGTRSSGKAQSSTSRALRNTSIVSTDTTIKDVTNVSVGSNRKDLSSVVLSSEKRAKPSIPPTDRETALSLSSGRVLSIEDLVGLDRVCRNAGGTLQGFQIFCNTMRCASLLAVGVVFRDLSTNHAVTSHRYCTPSTRCTLWHCTCEKNIRAEILSPNLLGVLLVAKSSTNKEPPVYFLPLIKCVEPQEENEIHKLSNNNTNAVLPIQCETTLSMRWKALLEIFLLDNVKMMYHVQVACLPLHQHLIHYEKTFMPTLFDPRLVLYLQNPDLEDSALELYEIIREEITEQRDVVGLGRLGRVIEKGGRELKAMLAAYNKLDHILQEKQLLAVFHEIETKTAFSLSAMEYYGVAIDREVMDKKKRGVQEKLALLEQDIIAIAGVRFNLSSPEQVSKVLFETLQISVNNGGEGNDTEKDAGKGGEDGEGLPMTAKKKFPSTSEGELVKLRDKHPIIPLLLDYRALSKILHTYLEGMQVNISVTRSVHPTWNQTSVRTGRLSCARPNMQNIPNMQKISGVEYNVRSLFYAREGYVLVCADYSQIEMRVLAQLTQDPSLVSLFRKEGDIYSLLASKIFKKSEGDIDSEERTKAKVICLGVLYGMGPYATAAKLKLDVATAAKITQSFFNNFSHVKVWITRIKSQTRHFGYVKTLFGRIRLLPDINSAESSKAAAAERQAVNSIIQGTAADLIKVAMIMTAENINGTGYKVDGEDKRARLVMQIHDELVFEVPEDSVYLQGFIALLKEIMEGEVVKKMNFSVPLSTNISVGKKWGEVKPWPKN